MSAEPTSRVTDIARTLAYYARFALRDLTGAPLPVFGGLSLTDICNLDCRHCWRKNTGGGHLPWDVVMRVLRDFYARGVRYLYLQGGEPYTWHDGMKALPDVVRAARAVGFFHVSVCTNGTYALDAQPDTHWVSLDGLAASHDAIRGSFDRTVQNIGAASGHVCANLTLNRINCGDLRPLAEFVASVPRLEGVMVNLSLPRSRGHLRYVGEWVHGTTEAAHVQR